MKQGKYKSLLVLAILSVLGLSACNIESKTDKETKEQINKTTTGVIDRLDQLSVNGVVYDTSQASVTADGKEVQQDELKLGMVVSVTGTENGDNTGKAMVIEYEDIMEGLVMENNITIDNTLIVMGQTVHIDDKTIFESNDVLISQLNDIRDGNIVEISGYTSGEGDIWATRIEVKKSELSVGDEMEIKGIISNLTESSFNLGELKVSYADLSLSADFSLTLENNLYVEVTSGKELNQNGELVAEKIKIKGDGSISVRHSNNDEEVELKGRITAVPSDTEIAVNGARVILSDNTYIKNGNRAQLAMGTIVEVEGSINAQGDFLAAKISFEDQNEASDDRNEMSDDRRDRDDEQDDRDSDRGDDDGERDDD